MHLPSVVVFDLGKVLVDFDYAIAARRIAARGKMTLAEIAQFIQQSPLFLQYESGAVTTQQFFDEIRRVTGFLGSLAEFSQCFADIFSPIEPMIQLQAALQRRGLRAYAFSNTNELAIEHIRRTFPFYASFDGHILSYEHGAMKPDARLYEVLERRAGAHGADLLYLDDRPENVAAGAARGWQAILQESPEKTLAAIRQLGLLNHS
ncbi:MAG TPA: HAD family phosphatase [Candidatus Paceibacterota bacterium]|nr:HAD family phosphatase [Verrucomicrobiota bacterium]HSA10020.1 HAD family phosphatase [Candidatus Paceibacterota bacterium]